MQKFEDFVEELSTVRVPANSFNQYAKRGPFREGNELRRLNLVRYLRQINPSRPHTILIGEAPSYRGARLTGVPFVSESILLCGVEEAGMLGELRGYRRSDEFGRISTEASATMVWGTIRSIRPLPLLWNAFPFHPFRPGNERSNRAPSIPELVLGQPFIERLLEMFPIDTVIAVGNRAAESLHRLGIAHTKVRHPSQGGKLKFVEGLRTVLSDNPRDVE